MASLMPTGKQQYFSPSTGAPLAGGLVYTYAAGTSTPKSTFTDAGGATANANPVVLDSTGSALIFWSGAYKVVVCDPMGNVIYTVDNYSTDSREHPVQVEIQTATAGQTVFTLTKTTYTPGINSLHVYVDGLRMFMPDYAETSTTVVTFASALVAGQAVMFECGSAANSQSSLDASNVPYTPGGGGAATNVAAALNGKPNSTDLSATGGAALVGASDGRTVQAVLNRANQTQSGFFYSDSGGIIQRMADRLFVGDGVQHDGKATPVTATWVNTVSSGIYEYLESHATALLPSMKGIGTFSAARSSTGGGTANDAAIGVAGFAYNDYVGGLGGVWGLYSTVLRKSGVNGATHGLEVDVGNLGTTVAIYPNAMFPSGLTDALWVCTGGETTNNTAVGTASCAIGIVQNDSQTTKTAKFDKGIVFHSQAIAGTDGATGTGIAMAFAKGHQQVWFNNSNQAIGEIVCTNGTVGSATRLDFTDYGTIFKDRASDGALFQIQNVANSANYLTAVGAVSGGGTVQFNANGADANLDIYIQPKGTGNVRFGAYTAGAVTQAGYITIKDNGGVVRRLLVG